MGKVLRTIIMVPILALLRPTLIEINYYTAMAAKDGMTFEFTELPESFYINIQRTSDVRTLAECAMLSHHHNAVNHAFSYQNGSCYLSLLPMCVDLHETLAYQQSAGNIWVHRDHQKFFPDQIAGSIYLSSNGSMVNWELGMS